MKNLLLTFVLLVFMTPAFTQDVNETVNEARSKTLASMVQVKGQIGDFTITDSDGETHNLYDALDAGKTVFVDLFFVD